MDYQIYRISTHSYYLLVLSANRANIIAMAVFQFRGEVGDCVSNCMIRGVTDGKQKQNKAIAHLADNKNKAATTVTALLLI